MALMLAPLALISSSPLAVYARGNEKISRMPQVLEARNSQTMQLLEGYLNTNPTGIGGPEIAIVDNVALAHEGDNASVFVDADRTGGQISLYVVREGDTLSSIADMFDVSINTITWANNIKGGSIKPGQELVILPISGVRHVVKAGDTIKTISAKYKADTEDVIAYNEFAPDTKLKVGDVVIVPNGAISASSGSSSVSKPSGSSIKSSIGYYLRPLTGGVRSQGIHGYNGVDIAASIGTPIMASADGKVIVSSKGGYGGGYGTYVVISHSNGTQTLYAHMNANNVSVGQQVKKGQVIGSVGNTGRSTGPHLHFEVRGSKNPF